MANTKISISAARLTVGEKQKKKPKPKPKTTGRVKKPESKPKTCFQVVREKATKWARRRRKKAKEKEGLS